MKISDPEFRTHDEPFGFYIFSWIPRKCRNGKWRCFCWLEKHYNPNGNHTYTLGNRAH